MGKGEIARYERFLLFQQCYQNLSVVDALKRIFMEKRVKPNIYHQNSGDLIDLQNRFPDHKVDLIINSIGWVPRGSVVKCLTRNPGVLGSRLTGSSGFFLWECPWARHFRA